MSILQHVTAAKRRGEDREKKAVITSLDALLEGHTVTIRGQDFRLTTRSPRELKTINADLLDLFPPWASRIRVAFGSDPNTERPMYYVADIARGMSLPDSPAISFNIAPHSSAPLFESSPAFLFAGLMPEDGRIQPLTIDMNMDVMFQEYQSLAGAIRRCHGPGIPISVVELLTADQAFEELLKAELTLRRVSFTPQDINLLPVLLSTDPRITYVMRTMNENSERTRELKRRLGIPATFMVLLHTGTKAAMQKHAERMTQAVTEFVAENAQPLFARAGVSSITELVPTDVVQAVQTELLLPAPSARSH